MNAQMKDFVNLMTSIIFETDEDELKDLFNEIKKNYPTSMLSFIDSNRGILNSYGQIIMDALEEGNVVNQDLVTKEVWTNFSDNLSFPLGNLDKLADQLQDYPNLANMIRDVQLEYVQENIKLAKENGQNFAGEYNKNKGINLLHERDMKHLMYFKDDVNLKKQHDEIYRKQFELMMRVQSGEVDKKTYMSQKQILDAELELANTTIERTDKRFMFDSMNLTNQADTFYGNDLTYDREQIMEYYYDSERMGANQRFLGYKVMFVQGEISEEEYTKATQELQKETEKINRNQQAWLESQQKKSFGKSI